MDTAKKLVAEWLDSKVIAETVVDALQDEAILPTLENAQKVWLDVLYTELGDAVRRSVKALAVKGRIS